MLNIISKIFNNNRIYFILTAVLFVCFSVSRIYVRSVNELGTDEIEQVSNLISFKHLLEYLPRIPGGAPGHYFITLPLNIVFPQNKYILGLPGLISQAIVFLFIPYIINILGITDKRKIRIVSMITRIGFVFNPTLTFQAMEVRPYSMLSFLWFVSVIFVNKIINFKKNQNGRSEIIIKSIVSVLSLSMILIWHYYGLIMVFTMYIYLYIFTDRRNLSDLLNIKRIPNLILLTGVLCVLPVWTYFSKGSFTYNFNAIENLPISISTEGIVYKGVVQGITWRNYYYSWFFLVVLFIFITYSLSYCCRKISYERTVVFKSVKIMITSVLLPIILIFTLDIFNRYWFLLRQFSWTIIPFYISLGVFISGLRIRSAKPG